MELMTGAVVLSILLVLLAAAEISTAVARRRGSVTPRNAARTAAAMTDRPNGRRRL